MKNINWNKTEKLLNAQASTIKANSRKPQHTPTPWNVDKQELSTIYIESKEGILIGEISSDAGGQEAEANAAFIVRAVNAYEKDQEVIRELLEALRLLTKEIHLHKLKIRKDFSLINAHACAMKAIAKASE